MRPARWSLRGAAPVARSAVGAVPREMHQQVARLPPARAIAHVLRAPAPLRPRERLTPPAAADAGVHRRFEHGERGVGSRKRGKRVKGGRIGRFKHRNFRRCRRPAAADDTSSTGISGSARDFGHRRVAVRGRNRDDFGEYRIVGRRPGHGDPRAPACKQRVGLGEQFVGIDHEPVFPRIVVVNFVATVPVETKSGAARMLVGIVARYELDQPLETGERDGESGARLSST